MPVRATVHVDAGVCRGTGLCAAMRPELFRLTDAGHATALQAELHDGDQVEAALEVAECCPVEAIVLAVAKPA